MKKVKFTGSDFNVLSDYGYHYSINEGCWISADGATVISEHRSPYQRQIKQYAPHMDDEHDSNITVLMVAGLAKEGNLKEKYTHETKRRRSRNRVAVYVRP